ncbi:MULTISPECIES: EAL domain-containing protein [unclassified Serratia (in: enterobacteria)]|uniref:EAL domain-containing response regulator n=1 Tax=unclassified Serratia (in: enterobacteria) TaxID=2647522 RepID=UPI0005086B1A|nr:MULTISPECIES: EAL domain-containing response regulator [unclassified Serratia (in: enterobacteria)]KFK92346.1 histidine kinase [Serratia sp. Ag2]KFL00018.1 histidine kinase [Serratia sp. Ag1]
MQPNYKVLVLDEHPHSIRHIHAMLRATGLFDVRIANSAAGALSLLENHHFHLAIIDMSMPNVDGFQFISEISKRQMNTMLALVSTRSRSLMNSVSLVAKEHGLAVIGTFNKPFCEKALQLLLQQMRSKVGEIPPKHREYVNTQHTFDKRMVENGLKIGDIKAWFQPKIDLGSGKIVGAEALTRWDHPEYGFMVAGSFLDAVRRYKLQQALFFRMLNDALDAHLLWQHSGYTVPVSLNLPVPLLDDPQLPDQLFQQVTERGVDPANLCFELLEDEAISHPVNYYMGTSRLRLKKFGLAQDNFGREYNSMYSLISTPFTELKIDKSFVNGVADDDMRKTALISSVQLGRQLGLTVTAEGVETTRDLQFLRRIGCDFAQGFLISAAISAEDFGILLVAEDSDVYSLSSFTF